MANIKFPRTPEQEASLKQFRDGIGAALTGNLNKHVLAEQDRNRALMAELAAKTSRTPTEEALLRKLTHDAEQDAQAQKA